MFTPILFLFLSEKEVETASNLYSAMAHEIFILRKVLWETFFFSISAEIMKTCMIPIHLRVPFFSFLYEMHICLKPLKSGNISLDLFRKFSQKDVNN